MDIKVITICGSMKFQNEMMKIATTLETEKGYCVIQPVYDCGGKITDGQKLQNIIDAHYKKIDVSDAIYVVNIGGYVGKSVAQEIEYAKKLNKQIIYHE